MYWVKVKRIGLLAIPRWYYVKGHSVTNATTRYGHDEAGKEVKVTAFEGPMRFELHTVAGRAVVFGDVAKIVYTLGKSWSTFLAQQAERESGGAVKIVK